MTSADCFQLLSLFCRVVPASFFRDLAQKHGYRFRDGIYPPSVVVWLMIWKSYKATAARRPLSNICCKGAPTNGYTVVSGGGGPRYRRPQGGIVKHGRNCRN